MRTALIAVALAAFVAGCTTLCKTPVIGEYLPGCPSPVPTAAP